VRVVQKTLIVWARLTWVVAEDIVEPAQPGAQALFRRLEHMFASLRRGSDGMGLGLQVSLHQAADPREDQISSLFRTRSITLSVNSVVPAWPPRSGVLTPAPTASSADS
jgi:hypothetical protein